MFRREKEKPVADENDAEETADDKTELEAEFDSENSEPAEAMAEQVETNLDEADEKDKAAFEKFLSSGNNQSETSDHEEAGKNVLDKEDIEKRISSDAPEENPRKDGDV